MLYRNLITAWALSLAASLASALDPTEEAIRAAILERNGEALALLQEAVDINSGTMNVEGVREVGQLFLERFDELGFVTEWIDGEAFGRGGHLSARYGSSGPRVLMIGHLDTVFAKDSEFQRFERLNEQSAAGPGITDMKGGDVVMLYALRALKEAGVLEQLQVHVVMTGDEESRGQPLGLSNEVLVAAGDWADIALGFEDGDSDPRTAVTARRSSSVWELKVSGKPAHSSQIFRDDIGFGAALEISRILDEWREALSQIPNLTFNPGLVMAGTDIDHDGENTRGSVFGKGNVIARTALATGGMRAISPEQIAQAEEIMRRIASDSLAQTSATVSFRHGYPPMAPSEQNERLREAYSAISEELGYGPVAAVDPRKAGAADISFVASRVDAAMDGLGLMGSGGHTVDEVADLRTLPQQTIRAALLLYRLSQGRVILE
ncbi:MAG: M20 family metallopeptidase [Congregibacter sp.]